MLIKVKKFTWIIFAPKHTPFKPHGEKHIGKKFFCTTLMNILINAVFICDFFSDIV